MSETALRRSPLHPVQQRGQAAFGEVDGWLMPRVYENIKREYLSAKGTVAVMDRSHQGRLRVTGGARLDLLHRLTTNDVKGLSAGQGAQTCLLTDKGRIIDDLRLHAREDWLLLITSPGNQSRVKDAIEKLRFRDDVTLHDVTADTALIALHGPQSVHLLEGLTRAHRLGELPLHHGVELALEGRRFLATRTRDVGGDGFNLFVEAPSAQHLWETLIARGDPYGVSPLGEEAWEILRIEAGIPRFGRELSDEHNPLEARLDAAISWTKGCYVGQEVVARLDSRQKISKLLVGLWLEPGLPPAPGSAIGTLESPGLEVGRLTSAAPSLDFRRIVALGYVRAEHGSPGTRLVVGPPAERVEAEVAALPFHRVDP